MNVNNASFISLRNQIIHNEIHSEDVELDEYVSKMF